MTTLIAAYNSEGCTGRCDAKCYNATYLDCDCICGGRNHGKGQRQAIQNNRQHFQEMIEIWNKDHPDTTNIDFPLVQLTLF